MNLAATNNKNHKLFTAAIVDLMNSQGFYGRLYRSVQRYGRGSLRSII
jgi:hypothetical protein